jgi:uncharacterized protein YajQ (UPF0234 family)
MVAGIARADATQKLELNWDGAPLAVKQTGKRDIEVPGRQEFTVTLHAEVEFQLKQMLDILKVRLGKRGIDVTCIDAKDPKSNLAAATQEVVLKHGIDQDTGRKVQRLIKDSKIKVQAAMQGDKVRVTGKKRDDLQEAIALLRKQELDVPLQFNNFRD